MNEINESISEYLKDFLSFQILTFKDTIVCTSVLVVGINLPDRLQHQRILNDFWFQRLNFTTLFVVFIHFSGYSSMVPFGQI